MSSIEQHPEPIASVFRGGSGDGNQPAASGDANTTVAAGSSGSAMPPPPASPPPPAASSTKLAVPPVARPQRRRCAIPGCPKQSQGRRNHNMCRGHFLEFRALELEEGGGGASAGGDIETTTTTAGSNTAAGSRAAAIPALPPVLPPPTTGTRPTLPTCSSSEPLVTAVSLALASAGLPASVASGRDSSTFPGQAQAQVPTAQPRSERSSVDRALNSGARGQQYRKLCAVRDCPKQSQGGRRNFMCAAHFRKYGYEGYIDDDDGGYCGGDEGGDDRSQREDGAEQRNGSGYYPSFVDQCVDIFAAQGGPVAAAVTVSATADETVAAAKAHCDEVPSCQEEDPFAFEQPSKDDNNVTATSECCPKPSSTATPTVAVEAGAQALTAYQDQQPQVRVVAAGVTSPAAASSRMNPNQHEQRYSQEVIQKHTYNDGSFVPAVPPKQGDDGLFQRPKGRPRKGMDWDAIHGIWRPTPAPGGGYIGMGVSSTLGTASSSSAPHTPSRRRKSPARKRANGRGHQKPRAIRRNFMVPYLVCIDGQQEHKRDNNACSDGRQSVGVDIAGKEGNDNNKKEDKRHQDTCESNNGSFLYSSDDAVATAPDVDNADFGAAPGGASALVPKDSVREQIDVSQVKYRLSSKRSTSSSLPPDRVTTVKSHFDQVQSRREEDSLAYEENSEANDIITAISKYCPKPSPTARRYGSPGKVQEGQMLSPSQRRKRRLDEQIDHAKKVASSTRSALHTPPSGSVEEDLQDPPVPEKPKKRGRGRPKKNEPVASPRSALYAPPSGSVEEDSQDPPVPEKPKKRGRGRPKKNEPVAKSMPCFDIMQQPPPRRIKYPNQKSLRKQSGDINLSHTTLGPSADGPINFLDTLGRCRIAEDDECGFRWFPKGSTMEEFIASEFIGYNRGLGRVYFRSFVHRGQKIEVGNFVKKRFGNTTEYFRIAGAFQATASFLGDWKDGSFPQEGDRNHHKGEIQKRGHPYLIVIPLKLRSEIAPGKELRELKQARCVPSSTATCSDNGSNARHRIVITEDRREETPHELSPYELLRLEKIQRNQAKLKALGLGGGSIGTLAGVAPGKNNSSSQKRKKRTKLNNSTYCHSDDGVIKSAFHGEQREQELVLTEEELIEPNNIFVLPIWLGEPNITFEAISARCVNEHGKELVFNASFGSRTKRDRARNRAKFVCRQSTAQRQWNRTLRQTSKRNKTGLKEPMMKERKTEDCDLQTKHLTDEQFQLLTADPKELLENFIPWKWAYPFNAYRTQFIRSWEERPWYDDASPRLDFFPNPDVSSDDSDGFDEESNAVLRGDVELSARLDLGIPQLKPSEDKSQRLKAQSLESVKEAAKGAQGVPEAELDEGWTLIQTQRKNGETKGRIDRIWRSPCGREFRSLVQLERFKASQAHQLERFKAKQARPSHLRKSPPAKIWA